MAKDQTKLLKIVVSKVEIGESADGNEPGAYTDIGLVHDEKVSLKAPPLSDREITGAEFQKAMDCEVNLAMMQVKDVSVAEGFKNKNCWIKLTDVSGALYKIKNFYLNVGLNLELYSKGKNAVDIMGKKYASQVSDFWATA